MFKESTRVFVSIFGQGPNTYRIGRPRKMISVLMVFTLKIQMSLLLGDPPGVWALYRDGSCQGSRVNGVVAFDLIGYEENSLKL